MEQSQYIVKQEITKSTRKINIYRYWVWGIVVCIGFIVFVGIYGTTPLNPLNDAWIMSGYDESDIIQHYSGWLAFRNSNWNFPLGMADNMAVGTGTMISYTDSIPWVAIFFKIFRSVLPETFQYFGLYVLVCFILQGIASFQIIYYKTSNLKYSLIGEIFFVFSPIMLERAFRHTALASHWLILFSILLYLKHRDNYRRITCWYFTFLEILAIGIHPYFLPMVFCFSFLCVIQDVFRKKYTSILGLGLQIIATYIIGCILGVLGSGVNISRDRYGFFSLNLNAVINPTSAGRYRWSGLLKVKPQILGNYDGFNYLGIGILLLLVLTVFLYIYFKPYGIKKYILNNLSLVIVLSFLTAFAVTNVVTWNDKILFQFQLPDKLLYLCGIFRASGRMFYPVYYIIYIFAILQLWKYREKIDRKFAFIVLLVTVLLQLFDLRYVLIEKHNAMYDERSYWSLLDDETLADIAEKNKYVIAERCSKDTRSIAVWAFKNGMETYFSTANSGNYIESTLAGKEIGYAIEADGNSRDCVIVTTDIATATRYMQMPSLDGYFEDGLYWFYENNEADRKEQTYSLGEINLDLSLYNVALSDESNDYFDAGVWKDGGKNLSFNYSPALLERLQNSRYIICGNEMFAIQNISSYDEWSIHVDVDSNADICRYPAILQLQ